MRNVSKTSTPRIFRVSLVAQRDQTWNPLTVMSFPGTSIIRDFASIRNSRVIISLPIQTACLFCHPSMMNVCPLRVICSSNHRTSDQPQRHPSRFPCCASLCFSQCSVAFWTDPQNERQSSWVIYACFQQRQLMLHPCSIWSWWC